MVARLVSVNVGMPRDVSWRDKTVRTGIWKAPVDGAVMVRRLNIDGDGQGDLAGHGGEHRAVMVYQTESYDYWRKVLCRTDLRAGHFGENFTVEGLSDSEVCIGDRYRIGEAEFEVTQPRVTCFRVGMRVGEPRMSSLLVAHHRPGFYFRVITEGLVRAGDDIVRTRRGANAVSVADTDALLYLPNRDMDRMRRVVDVPALSPGWRQSFRELLVAEENVAVARTSAWTGFRALTVTALERETPAVMSISLGPGDDGPLPIPLPGQYLTIRVPGAADPPPLRSYSLSGAPTAGHYRISVKREDGGRVSRWLHTHLEVGSVIESAAPRGSFVLVDEDRPVVLVSAGIGITPVLAMAHALAAASSPREIRWLHTTRSEQTQAFAEEVSALLASVPHARQHVVYTGTAGRPDRRSIAALGLPTDAAVYLCGPAHFMEAIRADLIAVGIDGDLIHTESFGGLPPVNPGVVGARSTARPHPPGGPVGGGPRITFARSGLSVTWSPDYRSILDLADACDVPTRYSCRSGVCHTCQTEVVDGTFSYSPPPLEEPPAAAVLICTAVPCTDLTLDL